MRPRVRALSRSFEASILVYDTLSIKIHNAEFQIYSLGAGARPEFRARNPEELAQMLAGGQYGEELLASAHATAQTSRAP